jgi:hypothetical protein
MDTKMKELEHKLSCSSVRSVIDDLMTDDMPPAIVSHIFCCRECRDHATTNARLRELVRDSHRVTVPADFDVRLRERLQNRTTQSRNFWTLIPTPALAAAATFVVTAAITFTVLKHMHGEAAPASIPTNTIATTTTSPDKAGEKEPSVETSDNSNRTQASIPATERNTTAIAYGSGRQTVRNPKASVETPTNIPGVTILLRDGQRGEQVMRVPQVIVGARSVVPRGSSGKRPQYEPSVF